MNSGSDEFPDWESIVVFMEFPFVSSINLEFQIPYRDEYIFLSSGAGGTFPFQPDVSMSGTMHDCIQETRLI
jgi:hypothetical protein